MIILLCWAPYNHTHVLDSHSPRSSTRDDYEYEVIKDIIKSYDGVGKILKKRPFLMAAYITLPDQFLVQTARVLPF